MITTIDNVVQLNSAISIKKVNPFFKFIGQNYRICVEKINEQIENNVNVN